MLRRRRSKVDVLRGLTLFAGCSDAELEEWVPRVRELAAQSTAVHVLFNNNYEDWGMQNARRMAHLLGVERQPPQTRLDLI